MKVIGQCTRVPRWRLAAGVVIYILVGIGPAVLAGQARGADGDIIILREVPPRTAYRPGPGELPIRAKANPGGDTKAAVRGLTQSGAWVGRELTNKDIASVVTGQGVIAGPGPMGPGLITNGVRTGAMSGTRSTGHAPYSSVGSMLTGAPGGGGGIAGAVNGAVGSATGELTSILKRAPFGVR